MNQWIAQWSILFWCQMKWEEMKKISFKKDPKNPKKTFDSDLRKFSGRIFEPGHKCVPSISSWFKIYNDIFKLN